ncbi:hypothetical protein ACHAQA_004883 [Verticillium albo-atrum]
MGVHKETPRVAPASPSPRRNPSRRLRQSDPIAESTHSAPSTQTQTSRPTRSKAAAQPSQAGIPEPRNPDVNTHGKKSTRPFISRSFLISDDAGGKSKLTGRDLLSSPDPIFGDVPGRHIETGPSVSTTPAWDSPRLTYNNWVTILEFAAESQGITAIDINWLLSTARSCRLLSEPALDVLYRCPPLTNDNKARSLVALLARPTSSTFFNYRAKIRVIRIDTSMVTIHAATSVSPFSLLQNLPMLQDVKLIHSSDNPPFRRQDEMIRWQYPKELFEALEVDPEADVNAGDKMHRTRLVGFAWNSRMMGRGYVNDIDKISEIHTLPSFAYLRKLRFTNFQVPSWGIRLPKQRESAEVIAARAAKDRDFSRSVAACLSGLKELEHLTFQSSSVVNADLLANLPSGLKFLKIINCWDIWSPDFANFLLSHGHRLESLVLDHNQALDLAFLTVLGGACPNLQELRMNLQYFRHYDAFDDSNPLYESLLLKEQVPTWPSSLQVIELDHLRQWDVEAATTFFQSLVDSAVTLPMLRHLVVRCMLNIPWKTRSEFRQAWEPKMNQVFLRPKTAPSSKPAGQARSVGSTAKPTLNKSRKGRKTAGGGPARQSGRIASKASGRSSRASSAAKDLRTIRRMQYEEPDSDEFDNEGESDVADAETGSDVEMSDAASNEEGSASSPPNKVFTQGLCDVVEIKLDNQKPREQQFGMGDFVDSEPGDTDPEWNSQEDSA